jgi:hypothetical protein
VSDLSERLQAAAVAAIADILPLVERDLPRVRSVLFEPELVDGRVVEAVAWIERKVNVRRLTA